MVLEDLSQSDSFYFCEKTPINEIQISKSYEIDSKNSLPNQQVIRKTKKK